MKIHFSIDSLEIRSEMKALDYRLTLKLGSMMVIGLGVIATIIKL